MRLQVLKNTIVLIVITLFIYNIASALPKDETKGDGLISIFNYHEKEHANIQYRKGNEYLPKGVKEMTHILRSRGDGKEYPMDLRLIELLDKIQDHFAAGTIEVVSGYRSPDYNRSLITNGRGVASESLHMKGMAADIHIDEIKEKDLFNYVKELASGGAGLYPRHLFVHVDVGPHRSWQEGPAPARVMLGTENNPNPVWSAITDKNEYAAGDEVKIVVKNNSYTGERIGKNFWVEKFEKGNWGGQKEIDVEGKSGSLSAGKSVEYEWKLPEGVVFGKYRIVIFTSKDFSIPPVYSNEFYIKR